MSDAGPIDPWIPWGYLEQQVLDDFAGRYGEHIRLEEDIVYPAAQAVLDAPALSAMGEEMQGRRMQRPDGRS